MALKVAIFHALVQRTTRLFQQGADIFRHLADRATTAWVQRYGRCWICGQPCARERQPYLTPTGERVGFCPQHADLAEAYLGFFDLLTEAEEADEAAEIAAFSSIEHQHTTDSKRWTN